MLVTSAKYAYPFVKLKTSSGPEPKGPSLRHLTMSRREPRYRREQSGAQAGERALFLANADGQNRGVEQGEKRRDGPESESQRQRGDFAGHDYRIWVLHEAIRSAGDKRRPRQNDDPRGPARPERCEDPEASQLQQDEQREPEAVNGPRARGPP